MSASRSPMSSSPTTSPTPTGTVRATFMTTLEAGHIYEDFTVYIINKNNKYMFIKRPGGNFPDYDAKFTRYEEGREFTLTTETKLDGLALKTKNMCVEFETRSKPMGSGINATKAGVWYHALHNYDPTSTTIEYIRIPTVDLRKYIADNSPYDMWGGNKKSSHFYLIPLSEMAKYRRSVPIASLPAELVSRIRGIPRFLVDNE